MTLTQIIFSSYYNVVTSVSKLVIKRPISIFIVICSLFWENMIFELQKFNLPCPSGKA